MKSKCAYVTLLTKTSYLPGVLVLDQCLRDVGAHYPLVVMVTPSVPEEAKMALRKRAIRIREVKFLSPPQHHTLASHDARFADTWTKLRCDDFLPLSYQSCLSESSEALNSRNSRYALRETTEIHVNILIVIEQRIVLLDCDMIVRRNMDELMTIELPHDHIAAVHVCACNPRGIEHYPNDWSGFSFRFQNFLTFIFT
jgi:hypothetical protein